MKSQNIKGKRGRGRPPTGKGEPLLVRVQPRQLAALDAWIWRQSPKPTRAEAIRKLVDAGLSIDPNNSHRMRKQATTKASELAARTVERVSDKSVPPEEQARRKRVLIRGPKEFRDIRADQPKTKR
jgi:hypothetical protein